MLPFDPSALAPQLAAMQQRERMLAELRRLDDQGGATDDNKAEIKELKRLLDEQRKQLAEQKKDQAKQKEIQNLLYEVLTELKDLDERLKDDDQFEAAAKEFIDLYTRTNFDWILDHKNYDSLDFKELANKTGEIYGALIKTPKLKIPIEKVEAWLQHEAEEKAKEEKIKKFEAMRRKAKQAEASRQAEAKRTNTADAKRIVMRRRLREEEEARVARGELTPAQRDDRKSRYMHITFWVIWIAPSIIIAIDRDLSQEFHPVMWPTIGWFVGGIGALIVGMFLTPVEK